MARPDDDHVPRAVLVGDGEVLAVAHVSPDITPEALEALRHVVEAVQRLHDQLPAEERAELSWNGVRPRLGPGVGSGWSGFVVAVCSGLVGPIALGPTATSWSDCPLVSLVAQGCSRSAVRDFDQDSMACVARAIVLTERNQHRASRPESERPGTLMDVQTLQP